MTDERQAHGIPATGQFPDPSNPDHTWFPNLNDTMQFDHVVEVHPDGTVTDGPEGVYAPECFWQGFADGAHIEGSDWTLMNGYSGQYGYAGPIMHASESIGGGMERDILATPGLYVAVVCYAFPEDDPDGDLDVAGWAVAYREA